MDRVIGDLGVRCLPSQGIVASDQSSHLLLFHRITRQLPENDIYDLAAPIPVASSE